MSVSWGILRFCLPLPACLLLRQRFRLIFHQKRRYIYICMYIYEQKDTEPQVKLVGVQGQKELTWNGSREVGKWLVMEGVAQLVATLVFWFSRECLAASAHFPHFLRRSDQRFFRPLAVFVCTTAQRPAPPTEPKTNHHPPPTTHCHPRSIIVFASLGLVGCHLPGELIKLN